MLHFSVTGKQMDVGDALREHIQQSVTGLVGKYFGEGIDAHAVLSREAQHLYCCDLKVHVGRGILLQASEKATDPHLAVDKTAEHIAKRMRRYKRQLRDHQNTAKHKFQESLEARAYVLAPAVEEAEEHDAAGAVDATAGQPAVIAEMTTEIPTLTVGEAAMRLDLADQSTVMFRNSGHGGLNVVYRRRDGHIGWIDPGRTGTTADA